MNIRHPPPPVGGETIAIYCAEHMRETVLAQILSQRGYLPVHVRSETEAVNVFVNGMTTAMVITAAIPLEQTVSILRRLRQDFATVPFIVILDETRRDQAIDLLETGADHYFIHPFETRALLMMLAALSRRQRHHGPTFTASAECPS